MPGLLIKRRKLFLDTFRRNFESLTYSGRITRSPHSGWPGFLPGNNFPITGIDPPASPDAGVLARQSYGVILEDATRIDGDTFLVSPPAVARSLRVSVDAVEQAARKLGTKFRAAPTGRREMSFRHAQKISKHFEDRSASA